MTSRVIKAFVLDRAEEEMRADRLAKSTITAAVSAQKEFVAWTERRGYALETMGKKELMEYHTVLCETRSKKSGELLTANTINGRFYRSTALFSILYREGIIKENPAHNLDLDLQRQYTYQRRPLTGEEITTFLESLDTATAQGMKDRTLFELIYSSGLRVSEAAALKVGDIDFDRREMIVRGKGSRDRAVPFLQVTREFLLAFLGKRIDEPDAWVFAGSRGRNTGDHMKGMSISERFRVLLRKFDMDKPEISTHSIRHSTATHLLENGASIRHVQELLGHKCIETTVRYTQIQTDGVFKVFRKYHPREHELFETVDDAYMKRFDRLLAGKDMPC